MTIRSQAAAADIEHEEVCSDFYRRRDGSINWLEKKKLMRLSLEHRGRQVKSLELYSNQQVLARYPKAAVEFGYQPTFVSELVPGVCLVIHDRVWTLTAITEAAMTKEEKLKLCGGCRNSFYNQPGNSTTGECWMLKTAEPVERTSVGYWQDPPYVWNPQTTLSCHQPEAGPNGRSWIKQDDPRIKEAVSQ